MSDAVSSEAKVGTHTTTGHATSNKTTSCPNSNWSREQLTQGSRVVTGSSVVVPAVWGRPGHLTETQADVYVSRTEKIPESIS